MLRLELAYLYPADIRRLLTTAGLRAIDDRTVDSTGASSRSDGDELVVEAQ